MMEQANRILTVLEEAGYEAYIIGGAVRDILMHQKPHDFDIVTSARPDTVIEVLRGQGIQTTDLVGKSFGVVVATLEGKQYEIAEDVIVKGRIKPRIASFMGDVLYLGGGNSVFDTFIFR